MNSKTIGLIAVCMTAATASAQNFMVYQYGASAGAVSQVSIANLSPNWVATGVRNSAGDMELITWKSTGSALVRKGSATSVAVSNASVSTVALTPNIVVTAGITSQGLQVTSWTVSSAGGVAFGSYALALTNASFVRMTKLDSLRALAAFDNGGVLSVISWSIINGQILPLGTATGAAGTIPAVAAVNPSWFVTAMRNPAGNLQLDSWFVNADNTMLHEATATAGAVSELDITAWDGGHVATPVRNGSGDLELIDWTVNTTTGAITRNSSETVGAASQVAATTIGSLIFTASLNSSGAVDAGVWGYNGSQITAGPSALHEDATAVAAAPLSTGLYSVTASRTTGGDLQLDVWSGDYVP
jgi:hypothetical protein